MRVALVVTGTIQGVGFRPFVRRAALARGLSGFVNNGRDGVRIEVEGGAPEIAAFTKALRDEKPSAAVVRSITSARVAERDEPHQTGRVFAILESGGGEAVLPVLPPDLATCADCWREVNDPDDRRFGYPFTNCVACGPRFSISVGLPYDRERTSMTGFSMCSACRSEYGDVEDRRYHAQPIACAQCGPRLSLLDSAGRVKVTDSEAVEVAAGTLMRGEIVALKGLGGFQLLCLASDDRAVMRLRDRKRRPHKPFAVMFRDLSGVRAVARVLEADEHALSSPEAPIVLLEQSGDPGLASSVAKGSPYVGAMLPPTPLHGVLLERVGGPVVCTSGNVSEEPLCITHEDAVDRLGDIADAFLTHDRPIVRPLDDSVVRATRHGTMVFRRARGYAPRPVAAISEGASVLAFGAHLKSTIALGHGGAIIPSQHLGDLDALSTREVLRSTLRDLLEFFAASPRLYVCDLHPDYASTRIALELASSAHVPLLRVQHHHAHVAACMAEHGAVEDQVLGLAWDGTGLGRDGTIWGGEALVCRGTEAKRVGHLRCFRLPGGESAIRDPRRVALGLLWDLARESFEEVGGRWFGATLSLHAQLLERDVNSPVCSSIGRLFDAVAALVEVERPTFEGQAAMELETLARGASAEGAYDLPLVSGVLDAAPLIRQILNDVRRGVDRGQIARQFHGALVEAGCALAESAGIERVALAGGCFQNHLLSTGLAERLEARGFHALRSMAVPPNDGGVSVGQAWLGALDARSRG